MGLLDRAVGNAISFEGSKPPEDARVIGQVERQGRNFIYFQGESGKFYYVTESGIAFAQRMEAVQRKTKK